MPVGKILQLIGGMQRIDATSGIRSEIDEWDLPVFALVGQLSLPASEFRLLPRTFRFEAL